MTRGEWIAAAAIAAAIFFLIARKSSAPVSAADASDYTTPASSGSSASSGYARAAATPGSVAAIQANVASYSSVADFVESQVALLGINLADFEQMLSTIPGNVAAHLRAVGNLKKGISSGLDHQWTPTSGIATGSYGGYGSFGSDFGGLGGEGSV